LRVETQAFPSAARLSGMTEIELLDTLFPNEPALRGAKALCVSHVFPSTGVRLPLAALRKKADELGIRYLIVDGAQALGMVDLGTSEDNIRNCDFYACPGHKWLNGPPGTGVLYIRNADIRPPEFYPTISQRMEKYTDGAGGGKDGYPMAKALQVRGCSNLPGFAAMMSALEFVRREGGSSSIEKYILGLSREIKDLILTQSPRSIVSPHTDAALLSGLTVFFPFRWNNPQELFTDKKTADWVVSELLKKKIQVRSIGFQDAASGTEPNSTVYALRVSTAYFNTAEQVDVFKNALRDVLVRI
jgi:selenocysteine lyase/cysteine desulfurase